jgi:hypothetical protein
MRAGSGDPAPTLNEKHVMEIRTIPTHPAHSTPACRPSRRVQATGLLTALALVSATAAAQNQAQHTSLPVTLREAARADHRSMAYDAPGDGSLWARGASYKACFDAAGAAYLPAFGARAPHDMPQHLSPDSVTIGGAPIAFERGVGASRAGDRVTFERGAFEENYDLSPDSVEQTFVFRSLPKAGDLVLHIPVASELNATETENGIVFSSEFGRVTYGAATVVDARGQRASAATHVEDGAITLRVDASFLAGAALPLVIDPTVTTVFVTGIPNDDFKPDAAWDPFNQIWLVVYAETFSATDVDVYARAYSDTGAFDGQVTVDVTSDAWTSPRCADNAANHQFLVVSERTSSTPHTIRGRIVHPNGTLLTLDPQFDVSDNSVSGDKSAPSVGGDPFVSSTNSFYCVAYVHALSASDSEIVYRTVSPASVLGAATTLAHVVTQPDAQPSVSKSNDTLDWLIAWRRVGGIPVGGRIYAAHVHWDGLLIDGPFQVTGSLNSTDTTPCASSPLHFTQRSAISFTRNSLLTGHPEILVAALDGTTVLQIADLNALEPNGNPGQDQNDSAIDSDGEHFVVAYSEVAAITGENEVYASDLFLAGNALGIAQSHFQLHQFGLDERNSRISAAHDVNSASHQFFAVYDVLENSTDHDIAGALFDAVPGGSATLFCAGTAAACPCGNAGTGTHGCANSVNAAGAALAVSGTPSTLNDSVMLVASGMPGTVTCLFFQGTGVGSAAFGDGLRCAAGTITRLATRTTNVSGTVAYPGVGDPSVSTRGAVPVDGGDRTYQVWYRNAAAFCTPSTFNLTNGALIEWAR